MNRIDKRETFQHVRRNFIEKIVEGTTNEFLFQRQLLGNVTDLKVFISFRMSFVEVFLVIVQPDFSDALVVSLKVSNLRNKILKSSRILTSLCNQPRVDAFDKEISCKDVQFSSMEFRIKLHHINLSSNSFQADRRRRFSSPSQVEVPRSISR